MRCVPFLAQLLALSTLCVAPAGAQELDDASKSAARDLGYEGVDHYQRGDFASASERLERAYQVVRAPTLGLWSARALEKVGKLVEAAERYLEVTQLDVSSGEAAVQKQAQQEAAAERAQLLPRIPNLVLKLEGAKQGVPQCTVDGVSVPAALVGVRRPVNPGAHRVEARLGAQTQTEQVTLREGETQELTLRFEELPAATQPAPAPSNQPTSVLARPPQTAPPASGSTQRTLGYVAVGLGGAALVGGGVAALLAANKRSSISAQCPNDDCLPSAHDDADAYNSLRSVSTLAFIGGAVLGGAGVVLLLTAPSAREDHQSPGQVAAWVSAGSAGISGAF